MTIEIFTLCDAATYKNGHVCILHTFENWIAPSFPARFIPAGVLKVRFFADEEGDHTLAVRLVDADGHELTSFDGGKFRVDLQSGRFESYAHTLLFRLEADVHRGEHHVALVLDGSQVTSLPVYVLQTTPPTEAAS